MVLLEGYTVNGACQLRLEDEVGVIAPGMQADLVVLERDLFREPAHRIHTVRVDMTMLAGRISHSRARARDSGIGESRRSTVAGVVLVPPAGAPIQDWRSRLVWATPSGCFERGAGRDRDTEHPLGAMGGQCSWNGGGGT